MTSEQERSLVTKAQAGDQQALGALWDAITPKLFGYLVNVTHNQALAEDLLQATWLKAIEALPRFQLRGVSISAWLFAIARNECKQHWRKLKQETRLSVETETVSNDSTSLNTTLVLEQILSKLSEDDHELLRLRYIADLSIKEIALVLTTNSVATRVRIHRALTRARKILISQNV